MSWNDYIDRVMKGGYCEEAIICGRTKGEESVWAKSQGCQDISAEEITKLSEQQGSYQIHGKKFLKLCETDNIMQLKEAKSDCNGKKRNITVGKANKCLVIGVCKPESQGNAASELVFQVTEYLRKSNM